MPKPLKLVHLANFKSTNIGNGALISGLEALLTADFPMDIVWTREPWDDYTFGFRQFDQRFVEMINSCDGLIVNGAVAVHGRDYLHETGMRFELPFDQVQNIKKPVVFYGISYRHFRGQAFHNKEILCKTLASYSENKNIFLGVRNDGTKKWFKETLQFQDSVLDRIHEIPDSGVFVQAERGLYPEILPDQKVIIFAPNDEDVPYRFGEPNVTHVKHTGYRLTEKEITQNETVWRRNRGALIQAIKKALTEVINETKAQLLLVPHYFDDLKFISDLVDTFQPRLAHQTAITTGLMRVPCAPYFYGRYLTADLAISMRVHSMSPCIGMGVPMIPLVTQPRMWDFLANVGLSDLAVDAFTEGLEVELIEQCLQVLADPGERRERFLQAREKMREEARSINSMIFRMFKEGMK